MSIKNKFLLSQNSLFWLLLLIGNVGIWLPMFLADFPTIGLGHDSQLFAAAINGELRKGNMPWDLMTKMLSAREDIFSYPYFGIMYPFYWTLGVSGDFSYTENLKLDFSSVVFHMVMASVTFSLFLKRVGCRYYVSVIFGLFYAYSLHLKMWSSWIWALSGYSWIPLCLLGIWECVIKQNYRIGIICLSLGFGLTALGTALPLAYALVLSGVWLIACLLKVKPDVGSQVKIYLSIFVGSVISFFIGASHLIPTLNRASDYVRWYSGGHIVGGLKPPYHGTLDSVLDFSLDSVIQIFIPIGWPGGTGHLYLGAAIIVLFSYYVWENFRQIFIWPLLLAALYFMLDAFGDATVVHRITYQLPLLGSIRYPLANVYIPIVIILIFSAKGLDGLITNVKEIKEKKVTRALCIYDILAFSYLFVAIGLYFYQPELTRGYKGDLSWLLFLPSVISVIWLAIRKRISTTSNWVIWVPLLFLGAQLVQNSMLFHPKIPKSDSLYYSCDQFSDLYENLKKAKRKIDRPERLVISTTQGFSGCMKRHRVSDMLLQSLAMMSGWDVLKIYQSPRPLYEHKLFNWYSNSKRLNDIENVHQAGITHILSHPNEKKVDDSFFKKVYPLTEEYSLYEIVKPKLSLINVGCLIQSGAGGFDYVTGNGSRKIKIKVNKDLEYAKNVNCPSNTTIQTGTITQINRLASELEYQVEQSSPSLFLSDQVFSDDWDVIIEGKKVEAFVADGYRLAAFLPAGNFKLRMVYNPLDFKVGFILTCLGVFFLLIVTIQPLFKNRP